MSFFKKLLGKDDLPPEQKERVLAEKEAKERSKQERLDAEQLLMEKYFGKNTGFFNKMTFSVYKGAIDYFERNIKSPDEQVLSAIPAEYDKTKKREIKGMLIATNNRLLFITSGVGHGEFVETLDYRKMNGIALAPDGINQKGLLIDYGSSRKVFDDIINNTQFNNFLDIVRDKLNEARRTPSPTRNPNKKTVSQPEKENKYQKLEQIAKLRDQGVLTEEEFQKEKSIILNS